MADDEVDGVQRDVHRVAARLAELTAVAPSAVPDTTDRDAGYAYFGRGADGSLFYAARERGRDTFRRTTSTPDELLGWIADDLAKDVAMRSCMARFRDVWGGRGDTRRLWFPEWSRLARALDPGWGDRADAEIADILSVSPYGDEVG